MSKNQGKGNGFLRFMAGKGFYVVLFVCVTAIAVSGYMLLWGGSPEEEEGLSLARVTPPPTMATVPTMPPITPKPQTTPAPVPTPITPAPTPRANTAAEDGGRIETGVMGVDIPAAATLPPEPEPTPAPTPAPISTEVPAPTPKPKPTFNWPVGRSEESLLAFFPDAMKEMPNGDWRVHTGVDLAADAGTEVFAAAAGEVISCKEDRWYGVAVEIRHEDGYVTMYGNLDFDPAVTVGQMVGAGDVIGTVGATAASELPLAAHLHFEIRSESGEYLDPFQLLP